MTENTVLFAFGAIGLVCALAGYGLGVIHSEWIQSIREHAHRRTIADLQSQLARKNHD